MVASLGVCAAKICAGQIHMHAHVMIPAVVIDLMVFTLSSPSFELVDFELECRGRPSLCPPTPCYNKEKHAMHHYYGSAHAAAMSLLVQLCRCEQLGNLVSILHQALYASRDQDCTTVAEHRGGVPVTRRHQRAGRREALALRCEQLGE
jgi:hypothetical protein